MLVACLNHVVENVSISSPGAALTDEQMSSLDELVVEFQAADYYAREQIVQEMLSNFKRACRRGVRFDEVTVKTVRAPLAALGYSQPFLAYSAAPLWKNKTSHEEFYFQYWKSDHGRKVCMSFTY
jgi:hypothetical protein